MFDLFLESSHRDDSNKRSNIGFGNKIMELASIEVYFTHVIWSSDTFNYFVLRMSVLFRIFKVHVISDYILDTYYIYIQLYFH